MLILNYISIETVVLSVVLLLCICILGIAVFIRQQIISQKQVHENNLQELNGHIWVQKHIFQYNTIMEQKFIKRQKANFYKMDILKKKCLQLYYLTKYLNN